MVEVFKQVGILFAFMGAGYLLAKLDLIKAEHGKMLSTLILYVFLPCNIFRTFATSFTVAYISERYVLLVASLAITLVLMVAGYFGAKLLTKNHYERRIYEYSLIVPNTGYMGYPLAENLLGSVGLLNFMLFTIPISIYVYTIGYCKLTKSGFSLKKLLNPVMITTIIGMIAGLVALPVPDAVNDFLTASSSCMGPVAMLLGGITLAQYKFAPLFKKAAVYIAMFVCMIVLPVALGLLLPLLGASKELLETAVICFSLPCGMNTIVFPKLVGENCEIGVSLVLVSNVIACVSVPLILSAFVM